MKKNRLQINCFQLIIEPTYLQTTYKHLQTMPKTTRATRQSKAKSEKRENYKNRVGKQSKWATKPKDTKHRVKPTDADNVSAVVVGHGQTYVHCNPLPPPPPCDEVYKKYVEYLVEEQNFYISVDSAYSQWKDYKHKQDIVNPFYLYSQYCENYEDSLKTPWIVID